MAKEIDNKKIEKKEGKKRKKSNVKKREKWKEKRKQRNKKSKKNKNVKEKQITIRKIIIYFVPYWTLKENLLGHKRAQDKSQKKGRSLKKN